jgi:signal transduction histidine kinase
MPELVGPLADARHVDLRGMLPATPCDGDSKRIAQVMTNLLKNAVHFSRQGGAVRLEVESAGTWAVLTVADEGEGIDEQDLPHIFERFYRADRSRAQGRTGLGLSICKAIVDAHGGTITAESRHGLGTTFTVRRPLEG